MTPTGQNELNELTEMVNLVEEVTHRIDELHLRATHLRSRGYFYFAVVYGCLSVCAGFLAAVDQFFKGLSVEYKYVGIAVLVLLTGAGVFAMFLATQVFRGRKAAIRELQRERIIQQEVITMVDEQIRRLKSYDMLSKISVATLGVRLSRLDRSEKYFEKNSF